MPPAKRARRGAKEPEPFTLQYFPVMAKGLGPTLVAEFSGLPWKGAKDVPFDWATLKPTTPFGQMPLLTMDGVMVAQTLAILNHIGKAAQTEGSGRDFDVSQMLIAEAEDIYKLMQQSLPTIMAKLGSPGKGGQAEYDAFFADKLPPHLEKLGKLCDGGSHKFTSSGETVGELYLWSILHQAVLVRPSLFAAGAAEHNGQPGALATWYASLLADKRTSKVLSGESSMGEFKQYFVAAPDEPMAEVAAGVSFDVVAREWRCKWDTADDKASLVAAQALLAEYVERIKKLKGVREVKRVVCGGCHDFKVVSAFSKDAYDETVGGLEAPFLEALGAISGITNVESQTYTFMTL